MDGEKQHGSGWGQHHLEASKRMGLTLCVERQGSLGTGVEAARVQACLEWATAFLGVLVGGGGTVQGSTLREFVVEDLPSFSRL